jgi:hypothetical protein
VKFLAQCFGAVDSMLQPWIAKDKQFSLLTHIAATGSVSLCGRKKELTAFLELESAFYSPAVSAPICFDVAHNCWFERANFYPDPAGDDRLRQQLASLPRGAKADEY